MLGFNGGLIGGPSQYIRQAGVSTLRQGFVTSYDADAADYIRRVEAADQQPLELEVRAAIAHFVIGCKDDGIWSAIKASCILVGARTLSGALIPLVGTAPTNFNFVAADYNRKTGLIGNASTKYLDSNRSNSADPQNSAHLALFVSSAGSIGSGSSQVYAGVGNQTGSLFSYLAIASFNAFSGFTGISAYNRSETYTSIGPFDSTGFMGSSRSSSTSYTGRTAVDGNTTASRTSAAPANHNMTIFAENYQGTVSRYSNSRIAFYSIGESLDITLLDARVTTLCKTIGAVIR